MMHGFMVFLFVFLGLALIGSGIYEIMYAYGNKTNPGITWGVSAAGIVSCLLGAVSLGVTVI